MSSTCHPENVSEHQFCFPSCLTVLNVLELHFSTRLNFMDCGLHLLLSTSCSTLDNCRPTELLTHMVSITALMSGLVIPNDCSIARLTPGLRASQWNQHFSSFSPSKKPKRNVQVMTWVNCAYLSKSSNSYPSLASCLILENCIWKLLDGQFYHLTGRL